MADAVMESKSNYHDEQNKLNIIRMRNILAELPAFCKQFFRGIENNTSSRTRLAYAYDLRVFFEYMHKNNSYCSKMEIKDFPLSILERITREDIEEYLEYVTYYQKDNREITNEERGKSRKLASLRSFYNYYYQSELIEKNPAVLIPMPKLHQKEIVRLDADEVAILLDQVEDGTKLTKSQLKYHEKTKVRDIALLTLLLGTRASVSLTRQIIWISYSTMARLISTRKVSISSSPEDYFPINCPVRISTASWPLMFTRNVACTRKS